MGDWSRNWFDAVDGDKQRLATTVATLLPEIFLLVATPFLLFYLWVA